MARFHRTIDLETRQEQSIPYSSAEEKLADDAAAAADAVVQAQEVENAKIAAIKANARRQALVAAIQGADDAQLLTYIQNHTTTNADTRVLLGDMALLITGVIRG